jgi:hypothetical protein
VTLYKSSQERGILCREIMERERKGGEEALEAF